MLAPELPELGPGVHRKHLTSPNDYPRHSNAPVLPCPLHVPYCDCGRLAEVQQSRDKSTAGRAFYMCGVTPHWHCRPFRVERCYFFKWIDGPEMYDPRIRLFPWDRSKTVPFEKFTRWVPPPPNPPEMTEEEQREARIARMMSPPKCHCGVKCHLLRPNPGVDFTPFFHCPLRSWVRSMNTRFN